MTTPTDPPGNDPWQDLSGMAPERSQQPPPPPPGMPPPPPGFGAPAGYGAPQGYADPGYGYRQVPPRNGLGTAAMVLGIVGILTFWLLGLGALLGLLAVIFGFIGRGRAKRGEASNGGMALTGIITGFVAMALLGILIAVGAAFVNSDEFQNFADCMADAETQLEEDACERLFRDELGG